MESVTSDGQVQLFPDPVRYFTGWLLLPHRTVKRALDSCSFLREHSPEDKFNVAVKSVWPSFVLTDDWLFNSNGMLMVTWTVNYFDGRRSLFIFISFPFFLNAFPLKFLFSIVALALHVNELSGSASHVYLLRAAHNNPTVHQYTHNSKSRWLYPSKHLSLFKKENSGIIFYCITHRKKKP